MKPRQLTSELSSGVESGGPQGEPSALSLLGTCSQPMGDVTASARWQGPASERPLHYPIPVHSSGLGFYTPSPLFLYQEAPLPGFPDLPVVSVFLQVLSHGLPLCYSPANTFLSVKGSFIFEVKMPLSRPSGADDWEVRLCRARSCHGAPSAAESESAEGPSSGWGGPRARRHHPATPFWPPGRAGPPEPGEAGIPRENARLHGRVPGPS